ncbi:MAG TPA: hypothetical protein VI728_05300, partial [Syntrophales bacterium]|nr:hypothetical protein [Syntrophales bacterium]
RIKQAGSFGQKSGRSLVDHKKSIRDYSLSYFNVNSFALTSGYLGLAMLSVYKRLYETLLTMSVTKDNENLP